MRSTPCPLTVLLSTLVLAIPSSFISAVPTSASIQAHKSSWATEAGGVRRAKLVIEQCLTSAAQQSKLPASCVRAAFEACEREHGTSQHDENDCSSMSYKAWRIRIDDTVAHFNRTKNSNTRLGDVAEATKRRLVESQVQWNQWNEFDCQVQAAGTEGGSIHPMTISMCLSNHAAERAIDLQRLIDWWLS